MNIIYRSGLFDKWFAALRDKTAQARILTRIKNIERGTLGDYKALGAGLYEIRMSYGPGYRLYFTRYNDIIILLLAGGDKSTQSKDILRARALMEE